MGEKKFYAVRVGRTPGIYNTWDDCKANVHGFPGAIYKSFKNLEDAKTFININSEHKNETSVPGTSVSFMQNETLVPGTDVSKGSDVSNVGAVAYVDGSYNVGTGEYSYGMLLYIGDKKVEAAEKFDDKEMSSMRNVAGEIEGSMHAMKYCLEHDIKSIDIYYDYEGIEKWALGLWKTNKDGTRAYKQYYDSIKDRLSVHFHKVKGHSGDPGNERADALAKSALGIE